jgi:hypothetical protein
MFKRFFLIFFDQMVCWASPMALLTTPDPTGPNESAWSSSDKNPTQPFSLAHPSHTHGHNPISLSLP